MSELICKKCKVRDCECVPYDVECDSCHRAYEQGAREFAEWLCASHIVTTPMGTRMWENDLIAEWQKGAENE